MEEDKFNLFDVVMMDGKEGFIADWDNSFEKLGDAFIEHETYTVDVGDKLITTQDTSRMTKTGRCVAKYPWGRRVLVWPRERPESEGPDADVEALRGVTTVVTGIGYDPVERLWSYAVDWNGHTWCLEEDELQAAPDVPPVDT
jgi:hypothetical protein